MATTLYQVWVDKADKLKHPELRGTDRDFDGDRRTRGIVKERAERYKQSLEKRVPGIKVHLWDCYGNGLF